jgi:hypothetical protein
MLLETCEFDAFWRFVEPHRGLFVGVNGGFFDAARAFILGVLALTCRRVSKAALCAALHLSEAELLAAHPELTLDGDDVVLASSTTTTATLQSKSRAADPVNLDQLQKILAALQQ